MNGKRRNHAAAFKARVALEAIKEEATLNEIGKSWEVHPVQVASWKKLLLEGAPSLFEHGHKKSEREQREREDELLRELGRLQVEVNFLKKKLERLH